MAVDFNRVVIPTVMKAAVSDIAPVHSPSLESLTTLLV